MANIVAIINNVLKFAKSLHVGLFSNAHFPHPILFLYLSACSMTRTQKTPEQYKYRTCKISERKIILQLTLWEEKDEKELVSVERKE